MVALTFDDGPWPHQTEAILKILGENNIKATFFTIGEQAERWPKLMRMLASAGMVLGNHTETHPNLTRLSPAGVKREIEQAQTNISRASGQRPRYFRPPGGSISSPVYSILASQGLTAVLWDVGPDDWKRPPASVIVSRVVGAVRPGAVVLLHDGGGDRSQTIAALPTIIKQLKAQGYAFVSLDALLSSSKKTA